MVQDIKEEKYCQKFSDDNYHRYSHPHSYGMNAMNSYTGYDNMNYQVNNIRRVDYSDELHYLNDDIKPETKPAVLWNLDDQNKRKSPFYGYSYQDEPVYKKPALFADEEDHIVNYEDWRKVDIEYWEISHTKSWLIYASGRLRQPYRDLSPNLIMAGRELSRLTRGDFLCFDHQFGSQLFDLLHEERSSLPSFGTLKPISDDQTSIGSENYSDGDSFSEPETRKKVGRPRIVDPKKKEAKVKLWEFIRNLLLNPQYCPLWICWEDYEKKRFRFVESDKVAKLWGERKNNQNMTYEKFSRAMRYYYPKNIFVAVPGRRLVYEFGSNATGLETPCPNFNQPISSKSSMGSKV